MTVAPRRPKILIITPTCREIPVLAKGPTVDLEARVRRTLPPPLRSHAQAIMRLPKERGEPGNNPLETALICLWGPRIYPLSYER